VSRRNRRRRAPGLFGLNRRNVELVQALNPRRHYPLVDDKLRCKQAMTDGGVPVPRTVAVCEGLFAVPRVLDELAGASQFVVKPANGSGGQGILVIGDRTEGGWLRAGGDEISADELRRHLANVVFGAFSRQLDDRAFVEERVRPHGVFVELWSDGLCDVRVITLRERPVIAMVRVPTRRSEGRANLHQGGLGLAVDLDSGRTVRAWHDRAPVERHPETGAPLLGLQIPRWGELLEVARRAARSVPLGYLGVDMVVDERRGPLVLELNARPGLEIQNVHGRGLGRDLEELL
jgi:alpha-L-glutamate ligase-like protein